MMDVIRVTIDMPVELNEAINAAAKRPNLSKAQYMRMGIEVLGLLAGMDGRLFLHSEDASGKFKREILIPGVLRGR